MIGMHPSLSSRQEVQRIRTPLNKKEFFKRETQRTVETRREQQRAAANILQFMRRHNGVIHGDSLQLLTLEFATTPQVMHKITLRKSGAKTYLELMTIAVRALLDDGGIILTENERGAQLGLPQQKESLCTAQPPSWPAVEPDLEFDMYSLRITNCRQHVLSTLAEY